VNLNAFIIVFCFILSSTAWASPELPPHVRSDVNFAVAGATTGSLNTVDVFDPLTTLAIRSVGLDTGGLELQVEFATRTLNEVDPRRDLFWVWAGANDYLTGTADPSVPPSRIRMTLERLYQELGARRFVVPNLFPLGFFPVLKSFVPPDQLPFVREALNQLALAHNQLLASELEAFSTAHPDSIVVSVDMSSTFLGFVGSYSNTTDSCIDEILPSGGSCDGALFFDALHFETGANQAFGIAAAVRFLERVQGPRVRRVIAFGDSLSDVGSFFDTTLRATGVGVPPTPPYFEMRFSDGPVAIDTFEAMIDAQHIGRFFAQPLRTSLSGSVDPGSGRVRGSRSGSGRFYVPKSVEVASPAGVGEGVTLGFDTVRCLYRTAGAVPAQTLPLQFCTTEAKGGSLVDVEGGVSLDAPASLGPEIEIELLFYP